jgi:exonuclease VII small subunit
MTSVQITAIATQTIERLEGVKAELEESLRALDKALAYWRTVADEEAS